TEISAGRAHHNACNIVGLHELPEGIAQLGIGIESHRVFALRPLERNHRDLALHTPIEMGGFAVLHFHGRASPLRTRLTSPSSRQVAISLPGPSISTRLSSPLFSCALDFFEIGDPPSGITGTKGARRSLAGACRNTSFSATSRSMIPVTLPFDTMSRRD